MKGQDRTHILNSYQLKPTEKQGSVIVALILSFIGGFVLIFLPYNISLFARVRLASTVIAKTPKKATNNNASFSIPKMALLPNQDVESVEVFDVFNDRAGLSSGRPVQVSYNGSTSFGGTSSSTNDQMEPAEQIPDFYERYRTWQKLVKLSRETNQKSPSVETVYTLSDMEAVGTSAGKSGREVLLHIGPENRVVSVKPGTKFFDSELVEIGADGPRFRKANGQVYTLNWARSQKEEAKNKSVVDAQISASEDRPQSSSNAASSLDVLQEAAKDRYKEK
jgi:hypothetical protein